MTAAASKYKSRPPKGPRKDAGKCARYDNRSDTIKISRARSQRDQRKHIQISCDERSGAAFKKRPPTPKDDRRGQGKFRPRVRAENGSSIEIANKGTLRATPTQNFWTCGSARVFLILE